MRLAAVLLAILLAFTSAEYKRDGNCSPALHRFIKMINVASNVGSKSAPMINMAKNMGKSYFGDHIPWEKMKAFSLRTTETCIPRKCITVQGTVTRKAHRFQTWFNEVMAQGKSKTTFEPTTLFLDIVEAVQREWDHGIMKGSEDVMPFLDQMNYFTNKMIRDTSDFESQSLIELAEKIPCRLCQLKNTPLTNATIDNMLPVLIRSFQKNMLKQGMMKKMRDELERLYDQVSSSKITMIRTLVKDMPKTEFMELVGTLTDSVELLLESPEVGPGIMLVMKAAVENLRSVDVDRLWSESYLSLLRLRSLHQNIDVEMFVMELHRFVLSWQKGWWLLETGRWPAMEKYLRKLARTITSDAFWERADRHYKTTVNTFESFYKQREGDFAQFIVDSVHPMLISAIAYIERFSNQVDVSFQGIADDISSWELQGEKFEPSLWQSVSDGITRQYMACLWRPENLTRDVRSAFDGRSHVKDVFIDLFFSGWPEHKRKPPGADKFFERMSNFVKTIVTSAVGECVY